MGLKFKLIFCFSVALFVLTDSIFSNELFNFKKPLVFPKNFIFSTSTASYQIEGGWNESGKGENIWDRMVHTNPGFVKNNDNGDLACDSVHKFKEDVKNIKYIGFKMYRFSLSWSRILPDGTINNINELGIKYYNDVLDELLENNIEPMVTLHHFDVPQPLQEYGGWLNESMIDHFEKFADLVFSRYGKRVKWWITINEPLGMVSGYGGEIFAPALNLHGTEEYLVAHNLIRAHAKVYRLYHTKYKSYGGKLSISANANACFPKTNGNKEDKIACERLFQFQIGWFLHPMLSSDGNYPEIMRKLVDKNSKEEGLPNSRLPYFTDKEIQEIRGSMDFLGMNHYTSFLATKGKQGNKPSHNWDSDVIIDTDKTWTTTQSSWLKVVPEGIRKILNKMKKEYNNIPIFITENGFSDFNTTEDYSRVYYYQSYLKQLHLAINEDGCNVIGFTVWSLMDNFEWRAGYTERFGLIYVDFNDQNRPRTMKKSAEYFRQSLKNNTFYYCM